MLLLPAAGRRRKKVRSAVGILSFSPNLEFFFNNDLWGGGVRVQAQLEFFGPTLTQKAGSTLGETVFSLCLPLLVCLVYTSVVLSCCSWM